MYNARNDGGYGRPKQMFSAVCDNCGRNCEVPFQPTGSKPVLCSNCFQEKNGPRRPQQNRFDDRTRVRRFDRGGSPIETREEKENRQIVLLREEIMKLNDKVSKLIEMNTVKEVIAEPVKKTKKKKEETEIEA